MRHLTLSIALVVGCPACVDPTPIVVPISDAGVASRDSSVDGGFDLAACTACLTNDSDAGCGAIIGECQMDPTCASAFECSMTTDCYGQSAAAFIQCGLPCANEAGLSIGSPGYANAVQFFACVTAGACKSKCIVE
jgi:hypothetical protein